MNTITKTPFYIRRFIQRGKRGYANCDTWNFCYYLSDVIGKGTRHLKRQLNGHPDSLTEGQWVDTLNSIANTFDIARNIINGDLYLIEDEDDRKKWAKNLKKINKKYKDNARCMTDTEIREFNRGWRLFKEYFFSLWD